MKIKKHVKKSKLGMAPGSLVFTGKRKMTDVGLSVIRYNSDSYEEHFPDKPEDLLHYFDDQYVTWINIDGLHDELIIELIGAKAGVHKLSMEDILSVGQRPKFEEFDDYIYVVLKMLLSDENELITEDEQISFILKKNLLISFQEKNGDVFQYVRTRLKESKGNIRKRGADYLLYALVDSIADHMFVVLEKIGERLDNLETDMLIDASEKNLSQIHEIRKDILLIRKSVYPLREMVSKLEKSDNELISKDTALFIRDLYDHTIQLLETVEIFRDMTSGILDLYMNSISNKMNNVMKVLTIIATIFIPLTFIAGIYGMNFSNMPELEWEWGYFAVLGIMFCIGILMLLWFRKKRWI